MFRISMIFFAIPLGLATATAAAQTTIPLENAGFEDPPLTLQNSWSSTIPGWEQIGISGVTYEVPWASPSPAQIGSQFVFADSIGATIQQEFGTIEPDRRYIFAIDVFALNDDPGNSIEAAIDIFQTVDLGNGNSTDAFLRTSYSVYSVPWYEWIKDFDLAPQTWTTVQVILDANDYPDLIGNRARVRLTGNHYAADNARLVTYEPGEYPPVSGQTYYVSSTYGDDENDGLSADSPWATFRNPNAMILGPGDRVLLRRGDHWEDELNLRGWGRPDAPIELASYGPTNLDRPRITRFDVEFDRCIVIQRPSNWIIRGMDVRHAKLGIFLRYHNAYNNENVTIEDCYFADMPDKTLDPEQHGYELAFSNGIWLGGHIWNANMVDATVLDGLIIRYCEARNVPHLFSSAFYFPPPNRNRVRNVHFHDSLAVDCDNGALSIIGVSNMVMERVVSIRGGVDNWAGSTLGMIQNAGNVLIDNNEFGYIDRLKSGDGVGFDFEGDCLNCTFSNNVIHDASGAALLILGTMGFSSNLVIEDNVFYNNAWNPWNNEINVEISSGANQNTGVIRNNGLYRRSDLVDYFSPLSMGFVRTGNRLETFDPSLLGAWWDAGDGLEDWSVIEGDHPTIESPPTWINSHLQPYLWVRMNHVNSSEMTVSFQREPDQTWTEAKSITTRIAPDGVTRDYWVDMRNCAEWMTVITRVRLSFPDAHGDDFDVYHVRFTGSLDPEQEPPIVNTLVPEMMTFYSEPQYDGSILESGQGTGQGGTVTTAGNSFRFGDEANNARYRGFFSFDTSPLPSDATIVKAQIGFTRQSVVGFEPWTFGEGLVDGDFAYLDLAVPHFGSSASLEASDWQTPATLENVGRFIVPYKNGLTTMDLLNPEALPLINRDGRTQLRLYMSRGTNFNNAPDYINIHSGAAQVENRPFFRIEYYTGTPPLQTPPPEPPDPWIRPLTIPRPPLDLAITDRSSSTITWAWTDDSNQEEEFLLYLAEGDIPPDEPTLNRPANTTFAETDGLQPNTYHVMQVSAANTAGESGRTGAVVGLTHAATPGEPQVLEQTAITITLAPTADNNPPDTEYAIQVSIDGTVGWLSEGGTILTERSWFPWGVGAVQLDIEPGLEFEIRAMARNREQEETPLGDPLLIDLGEDPVEEGTESWIVY